MRILVKQAQGWSHSICEPAGAAAAAGKQRGVKGTRHTPHTHSAQRPRERQKDAAVSSEAWTNWMGMREGGLEKVISRKSKGDRHHLSGSWGPLRTLIGELFNLPHGLHKPILFYRTLKRSGSDWLITYDSDESNTYWVWFLYTGTVLSNLHALSPLTIATTLWGTHYYYFFFTDEIETGEVMLLPQRLLPSKY